jgi:uncharacterized protein YjbI with pentapeptide repeats
LTGAELSGSALTDVTFADCLLDLAGLRMTKLERVAFEGSRMNDCDLYEASLTDVLFDGCDLRQATLSSSKLTRVEIRGCKLDGLRGTEALRGVRLPWADVIHNAGLLAGALGIDVID